MSCRVVLWWTDEQNPSIRKRPISFVSFHSVLGLPFSIPSCVVKLYPRGGSPGSKSTHPAGWRFYKQKKTHVLKQRETRHCGSACSLWMHGFLPSFWETKETDKYIIPTMRVRPSVYVLYRIGPNTKVVSWWYYVFRLFCCKVQYGTVRYECYVVLLYRAVVYCSVV